LKDLKFSPREVNVLDPLEIQLENLGIIRHCFNCEDLRNTDPDFLTLQRHFDALETPSEARSLFNDTTKIDESIPTALLPHVEDSGLTATFTNSSPTSKNSHHAPLNVGRYVVLEKKRCNLFMCHRKKKRKKHQTHESQMNIPKKKKKTSSFELPHLPSISFCAP
jgi:hypothetical protein